MITFNISCITKLKNIINDNISNIIKYKYHIFIGNIGEGKTTIIRMILKEIGVIQEITSPTFNYIKILNSNIGTVAHIDLYRLKNKCNIEDITQEYDVNLYFIEWGDLINTSLHDDCVLIWIIKTTHNVKILKLNKDITK